MKKKIFLFVVMMLFPFIVYADHIYNIDMEVYLNQDGSANITEVWDVQANSGTEWYKQLYNLGTEELSNFKVSMDGTPMTYKEWNVNESLSQKSGYYGINRVYEGLELCFGKGDMNRHKFTLTYTLSNFITNVSDAQVLYQTLFPNVTLDNFNVTVSSFYEFPDTIDVWGFGYQGLAVPMNGKIVMTNDGYTVKDNYVVLLVKFPSGTFTTDNYNGDFGSFDDVLKMAQEGTFNYDYGYTKKETFWTKLVNILKTILYYIIPIGLIGGALKAAANSGYGYKDNKEIDKKNVPMFRDIPCGKDIYYANALINLNNFGYNETNIFGAIILKWIRQGKIAFKTEKKGVFNRDTSVIDLTLNPTFDVKAEQELFDIMYKASGDGLLEAKELEKWARKNYDDFLEFFKGLKEDKITELVRDKHIYTRTSKEECKKKNVMDDTIYEDSQKLYGLKKFLQEFSDMKNKEAIEVQLWDEYLMFAYLFGMAEKVAKQFKNLYPEVVAEMEANNLDYGTFVYINNISSSAVHAASAARRAAENYSGGGGGFSVGGGGGGSFGGGGSMGGR